MLVLPVVLGPMGENRQTGAGGDREALKSVESLINLMIALATATALFSGTFLKDIVGSDGLSGNARWLLYTSWILLAFSFVFGLVAHGRMIQNITQQELNPYEDGLKWMVRLQQMTIFFGLVFFAVFALVRLP